MKYNTQPFDQVFKDKTSGNRKFLSTEYKDNGALAIVDQGQAEVAGFTNEIDFACKIKLPCVLFGDHTKKFQYQETKFALGADGVKALEVSDNACPKYAYYVIAKFKFPEGTGYSRHFKFLKEAKIPLPPLAEQRRIAAILDKADAICRKRQEALKLADAFVKSVFLDMFGDPVLNPKGWEELSVKDVVQLIEAGWSADGESRLKTHNEKAVLKVSAVTQGFFRPEEHKALNISIDIKKYVYPQVGDLLFSRANTKELVGATCVIYKDYPDLLLPDKLWRVRFTELTNVFYMKFILSSVPLRNQMTSVATGTSGSMYNVSIEKFKNLKILLPPLPLQNRFAEIVQRVEAHKQRLKTHLAEAEQMKKALQQEFFG